MKTLSIIVAAVLVVCAMTACGSTTANTTKTELETTAMETAVSETENVETSDYVQTIETTETETTDARAEELKKAESVLRDFLEAHIDELIYNGVDTAIAQGSSTMIIDDLNGDEMPDLIYSVINDWETSMENTFTVDTHILIYDNGQLTESSEICFEDGKESDYSQFSCAMRFGTAKAHTGTTRFVKSEGAFYIFNTKMSYSADYAQIGQLIRYEYHDGIMEASVIAEEGGFNLDNTGENTYLTAVNDEAETIKEILDNNDWIYNANPYALSEDTFTLMLVNDKYMSYEEAIEGLGEQ